MLNPFELQRYIKASAARAKMNVVFEDKVQPRTNGKTVWLPRVTMFTTEEQARQLRFYVNHEASHIRFTDFDAMNVRKVDPSSFLGWLDNMTDDIRIDTLNGNEYEGDRLDCDFTYPIWWKRSMSEPSVADVDDKFHPILAWASKVRSELTPSAAEIQEAAEKRMTPTARAYYDAINNGPYTALMQEAMEDRNVVTGSLKAHEVARRIFEEVYGGTVEEENGQAGQQGGQGDGKGEGDGVPGNKKQQADKAGDGENKDEGDKQDGDKSATKLRKTDWNKLIPAEHDRFNQTHSGLHIDYSTYQRGQPWPQCATEEYVVADFPRNEVAAQLTRDADTHEKKCMEKLEQQVSQGFTNQVRAKLQIRARTRIQHAQKKGKIDPRNLWRCTVKDAGDRLFQKTTESDTLDVAVSVLVDCSGSMSGEKYHHAAVAARHLNEALGNTLHIPLEMACFSTHSGGPLLGNSTTMFIIRDFNTKILGTDEVFNRMAIAARSMASNLDGEAIMFMYDRLMRQRSKRKLLVVLSDGSPAGGGARGDIAGYTHDVIEGIQNAKRVDIVGIGIQDDNVTRLYKENYVISNCSELETALLTLIDKKVI